MLYLGPTYLYSIMWRPRHNTATAFFNMPYVKAQPHIYKAIATSVQYLRTAYEVLWPRFGSLPPVHVSDAWRPMLTRRLIYILSRRYFRKTSLKSRAFKIEIGGRGLQATASLSKAFIVFQKTIPSLELLQKSQVQYSIGFCYNLHLRVSFSSIPKFHLLKSQNIQLDVTS